MRSRQPRKGREGPVRHPAGPDRKTPMAQICCHPECSRPISGRRVLCSIHWRDLNDKTRSRIQNAYRVRLIGYDVKQAARTIAVDFFKK